MPEWYLRPCGCQPDMRNPLAMTFVTVVHRGEVVHVKIPVAKEQISLGEIDPSVDKETAEIERKSQAEYS